MYRCHFTKNGRIVLGESLTAETLEDAILEGERMLAEKAAAENLDGIEIWARASFLYTSLMHAPIDAVCV
jgi:hypothetical protein